MVNILDKNAAQKIIDFQRETGWDINSPDGSKWQIEITDEIARMRKAFIEGRELELETRSESDEIYGQGGMDRFYTRADGEIILLQQYILHSYSDAEKRLKIAIQIGFQIQ